VCRVIIIIIIIVNLSNLISLVWLEICERHEGKITPPYHIVHERPDKGSSLQKKSSKPHEVQPAKKLKAETKGMKKEQD